MSKTVDTDPMTPLARHPRTQPLSVPAGETPARERGHVDTQPIPVRVDPEATSPAEETDSITSSSDTKLSPIIVPSPGAAQGEPPPSGAPSRQRVNTQPFPLPVGPTGSPEPTRASPNDDPPPSSSRGTPRPKADTDVDAPVPLGASAPLRKEDLPALFQSIANSMREPDARIAPPPSEEMRYIAPRPLGPKGKMPAREERVVVRRSVMEPIVVPPRSGDTPGTPQTAPTETRARPERKNAPTVLTERVARKRRAIPGLLVASSVAVVVAATLILTLRHPPPVAAEPTPAVAPSSEPTAPRRTPSGARATPADTTDVARIPPVPSLPATTTSAQGAPSAPAPRSEDSPSRSVKSRPTPIALVEANRSNPKPVHAAPTASSAPSATPKSIPYTILLNPE